MEVIEVLNPNNYQGEEEIQPRIGIGVACGAICVGGLCGIGCVS